MVRKSGIATLTIGVLLALGALRGADLWSWRAQILRSAQARAANMAFIFSAYFRESFAAGDASLRQLAIHSQRIGGPSALATAWVPSLASARAGLRDVGSISITDAAGTIRHSTQPAIVGQSRAEQYLFKRLSTAAVDELAVDTPYLTVVEPRMFLIPIGRRLTDASGQFAGIVVATILPEEMRGLFRTVDVGQHGIIWVFHPDGQLLFREPSSDNPIGTSAAGNPVFEAARRTGTAGGYEGPIDAGGRTYLSAFHMTSTASLYVAVSLDRDEVLDDWRRQAQMLLLISAVIGATTITTLLILFRQMDGRTRALAAALDAEQRARRASEEAGRMKEEFLMTVSHELRTPLQSILGWTRVLLAGGLSDPETTTTALETIERNVGAQTTLINDLLDLSRGVSGKLRLDVQPVDLAGLVRHVVETSKPAAAAKAIELSATIGEVQTIAGDPVRLQQIVWNLVSNAIKFTPDGGRVALQLTGDDSQAEIVVADTGVGIAREFLPHVFERFRQADGSTTRRYGGLGLGLAIVRHLVELHGGLVTADSAGEGHGAAFRVVLPIRPGPTYTERGDDSSAAARE